MEKKVENIIHNFLHESRNLLRDNIIEEYLFGSYATDTQTPISDIDILIIVREFFPEMQSSISELASKYALNFVTSSGALSLPWITMSSFLRLNRSMSLPARQLLPTPAAPWIKIP